jgi:hypothetical protein
MAVTTTTRFGITRWSAGGDPFTRAQMDASHAAIESLGAMHQAGTFAARPAAAAANAGLYYLATDTGVLYLSTGSAWRQIHTDGETTMRFAWTYVMPGEIKVASGSTDYMPWAHLSIMAGQTVKLVGYKWLLGYGTSFTFSMLHNDGATTTTLSSGVVATSAGFRGSGTFGSPMTLSDADDGDIWKPNVTAVSGTPTGGAVALIADVTI